MRTDYNSATSNNMKLVHWPLMGGQLRLVRRGGAWAGIDRQCTNRRFCVKWSAILRF